MPLTTVLGEVTVLHVPGKPAQVPFESADSSRWSEAEPASMPEPESVPFADEIVTEVFDVNPSV